MNRSGKIALFALSVTLLGSASARAADANVAVNRVSVFYGDLDLSKQAGAKLLLARIKTAATEACGGRPDSREIAQMDNFQSCMRMAMDSAVTRLGNAKVAELYGHPIEQLATRN
jgi:UrcA family protein